jgi:hypothetical protein
MSFNISGTQSTYVVDVRNNYKTIAEDFCIKYYTIYDNNFMDLNNIYYAESQFTFLGNEIIGFSNFVNKLRDLGIYKFLHHNMNIVVQPIGPANLIITVSGFISLNSSLILNKFVETIFIQRDNNNLLYVCSTVFKITE